MRVNFVSHEMPRDWYPLVQVKPGQEKWVVLHAEKELWKTCFLHWDNVLRKGCPCLRPKRCPWCPAASRIQTYIPALSFIPRTGHWAESIVYITEAMRSILDTRIEDCAYRFSRTGRANSVIRWEIVPLAVPYPRVPRIDIVPSLYKMWGCQNQVDTSKSA